MQEKQANTKLGKNQDLQNSIINHLTDYFIFWKDSAGIYLGCNEAFARSLGFKSTQEIVGKTDYDLPVKKEDSDAYRADDRDVMASKKPKLNIEEPQTLANGDTRVLLTSKVPLINEDGHVYGVLAIYSDITERRQMEKETIDLRVEKKVLKETIDLRVEKQVLEEQGEMTRLLAASMAHELRTPLRTIESSADGIKNSLPQLLETYKIAREANLVIPFLAPLQVKLLSGILENIKIETRAAFSVIDMLLMNTSSASIDKSTFKIYSIAKCIDDALTRYPLDDKERNLIRCKKNDFSFHGDDILVIHIIFNLLKNALYYLKAANKGEIQIWCNKNEEFNILHFKDTSLGIDADVLPHIFDRFYTRTRHGTGVGLAFCKLVMQSMGGDITCQSVKGEYTDFKLFFPMKI